MLQVWTFCSPREPFYWETFALGQLLLYFKMYSLFMVLFLEIIWKTHETLCWDRIYYLKKQYFRSRNKLPRASLVAQWLRIHLPRQGTRVRALVWEDPTCRGATKPVCHSYWAHMPQLLKPARLELVLCNKRSHHNEKPAHHKEE